MSAAAAAAIEPAVKVIPELEEARWRPMLDLPCRLTVDLALPGVSVEDFLALAAGSVLNTHWGVARDLPLKINGVLIGWGELEEANNRLAIRVTELA